MKNDCVLKIYESGSLVGKYCLFIMSDKAKKAFPTLEIQDLSDISIELKECKLFSGYSKDIEKVEKFLNNHCLTFSKITIL